MQLLSCCLVLAAVLVAAVGQWSGGGPLHRAMPECPPCDTTICQQSLDCPAGQVLDGPCACCTVCALPLGSRCFNQSINGLRKPPPAERPIVPCGENLECLLRKDLSPTDALEALCSCKQVEQVCGTDNNTYENICQLQEACMKGVFRGLPLAMKNWGPCESAPEITGRPESVSEPLFSDLALSCKAKGNPIPDIHWEFKGDNGNSKNLPSDDQSVSVQVRGGPDSYMVSSWMQIMNLQANYTGTYTCVAINSVGVTRAESTVGVYSHVN